MKEFEVKLFNKVFNTANSGFHSVLLKNFFKLLKNK